jgi:zinc transporter ZupT
MEPLNLIYLIKVCLGALTAIICLVIPVTDLFTGISIGLMVYLVSDRLLKQIFIEKVEKPSTVTKTGIGIYIIIWVFCWILIYTTLNPNPILP